MSIEGQPNAILTVYSPFAWIEDTGGTTTTIVTGGTITTNTINSVLETDLMTIANNQTTGKLQIANGNGRRGDITIGNQSRGDILIGTAQTTAVPGETNHVYLGTEGVSYSKVNGVVVELMATTACYINTGPGAGNIQMGTGNAGTNILISGGDRIKLVKRNLNGFGGGLTIGSTGTIGGHSYHYRRTFVNSAATTQVFKIIGEVPWVDPVIVQFEIVISGYNVGYGVYTNRLAFSVRNTANAIIASATTPIYGLSTGAGNVTISFTTISVSEIRVNVISPGGTDQSYGIQMTQFPMFNFNFGVVEL